MSIKFACVILLLLVSMKVSAPAQEQVQLNANHITVYVSGLVNKRGSYVLPVRATVLDALASAGNVAKDADLRHARLFHAAGDSKGTIINVGEMLKGNTKPSALLDGDTLIIPEWSGSICY